MVISASDSEHDKDLKMDLSSDLSDGLIPAKVLRKYKCEFCKKLYVDQRCFKSHVEGHAGKKYTCERCPKWKFINILAYNHHQNFHKHGDNYLVCEICKDKFEESYQLASHKRKHEVAHLPCLTDINCEKKFKHTGDQRRHSRTVHCKTKDFSCKVCGKMFHSPQSRAPHEKNCVNFMETKDDDLLNDMSRHELSLLLKSGK